MLKKMMTLGFGSKQSAKKAEESKEESSLLEESRAHMEAYEQGLGLGFTCPICKTFLEESEKAVLPDCGHFFC